MRVPGTVARPTPLRAALDPWTTPIFPFFRVVRRGGRAKTGNREEKRKMNRLREKKLATLLIAIFMISIFAVMIPVSAQDMEKPEVIVRAVGQYTPTFQYGSGEPTVGHRCFINLHAKKVADEWTGQGVFRDKDYSEGELVAIFTLDSTTITTEILPHQVNFGIKKIDVYIDDEYDGTYGGCATLFMGELFDQFSFQIPYLCPRGYYAFESGYRPDGNHVDINVNLNVKVFD